MNDAVATGIAVALVLLCALHWRFAGMPARVWGIARSELARARTADDAEAHKLLQEAADAKVGTLVAVIRQYQEQIAANFRKQVADAELRTRLAERNASDTTTALETATALVRELRATIDGLGELPVLVSELRVRLGAAPLPEETAASAEPDDRRKTIEMKPPVPEATAPQGAGEMRRPRVDPPALATDADFDPDRPSEPTRVFGGTAAQAAPGARRGEVQAGPR